jgi:hypothetical protein
MVRLQPSVSTGADSPPKGTGLPVTLMKPAFSPKLPAGWQQAMKNGRVYYFNQATGETSLEPPTGCSQFH